MATLGIFLSKHFCRNNFIGSCSASNCIGVKPFKAIRKKEISNFDRLQIWTGLYLAIFLVIHVSVVLVGRFILHLDTNFYFGVAGLNSFPFSLFFILYPLLWTGNYFLFGHIDAVHR